MFKALSGSYSVLSLDLAFEMDIEEDVIAVALETTAAAVAAVDRRRRWRAEMDTDISRVLKKSVYGSFQYNTETGRVLGIYSEVDKTWNLQNLFFF